MSELTSGFHWRDGWYFKRLEDGAVRVMFVAGEYVYTRLHIPPNEWASIVCSVSAGGETGERYEAALQFHGAAPAQQERKQP
jgi:hypothetical protein